MYNIFVPQKVLLSKIFGDVIAGDWSFGPPPQSKILAMPMVCILTSLLQLPVEIISCLAFMALDLLFVFLNC